MRLIHRIRLRLDGGIEPDLHELRRFARREDLKPWGSIVYGLDSNK